MGVRLIYYLPSSRSVCARIGATAIHSTPATVNPCAAARRRERRFHRTLRRRCAPKIGGGALVSAAARSSNPVPVNRILSGQSNPFSSIDPFPIH